jgi:hypothetical protein
MKFVPSILTNVKPNVGPVFGVTFVTVGPADAGEIVIDRLTDVAVSAGEEESVTLNTSPDVVPAAPGVPVIAPVELFNVAHDGRVPPVSAQV